MATSESPASSPDERSPSFPCEGAVDPDLTVPHGTQIARVYSTAAAA